MLARYMRPSFLRKGAVFIGSILATSGCTTTALQNTTVNQGETLTDIYYKEVLDNLARFRENSDSLPWHLKVTQGSAQINDTLNPSFMRTWPTIANTLGLSLSRVWAAGWTVVPEIGSDRLYSLQQIYQNAVKPAAFDAGFEEGAVPTSTPYGEYNHHFVWVRPGKLKALTALTLTVLQAAPVTPGERAFQIPGLPLRAVP